MMDKMDLNDNVHDRRALRGAAEDKLGKSPDVPYELREQASEEIIQELRVHQIELEIQNEELKGIQLELEGSRDKYQDLYDFSPVGYFTLTHKGIIREVNLTGAMLLGMTRPKLIGRGFGYFVVPESLNHWDQHILSVIGHEEKQTCDLTLKREDGSSFDIRLESIRRDEHVAQQAETEREHLIRTMVIDLTERKRAEDSLSESERKYRLLFDIAPIGIILVDKEGKILEVNRSALNILGSPGPEATKAINMLTFPPLVKAGISDLFRTCMTENRPIDTELFYTSKWGKEICLRVILTPKLNERGYVEGCLAVTEDVMPRKLAEQGKKASEEKYRLLFENAPTGIIYVDKNGSILEVNSRMVEVMGSPSAEKTKEINMLTFQPLIDAGISKHFQDCITKGERADFEVPYTTKWGKKTYLRIILAPVYTTDRKNAGCLAVYEEITQRKMAEDSLRESERRFRLLLEDVSSVPVQGYNAGRVVVFWNSASERLYGYSRDEALGKKLEDLIIPSHMRDEVISAVDNLVQNGQRIPASEIGLMRKDGSIVPVYSTHVMLEDSVGQKELYCVDLDLSDLKKAEEERTTLRNQLMRAQKMEAIGTLAGGIAHDFNNLLQVVVGYSQLMINNPALPDQFKRGIESIHKVAANGTELVGRLLTFARKTENRAAPLNLNDKITQILELLDRTIPKMIQIELKLSKDPTLINADSSQIDQIIMNLAVNAGHAMPERGKLVIETQIVNLDRAYGLSHMDAKPGPYVLLSVSDTGHGIDRKTVERIFEPFFTTKGPSIGTGLGLSMVYGIVKQHGGHITCYSEPGAGTTFKIYFPAIVSEVKSEKPKDLVVPKGGTETILLVDDNESVRDLGEEMLLEYGYRVITASNGREALQIYSSERENISLVILDLFMPEMGGKECLRALLRMDPKVRVLLVSGFTQNGEIRDALDSGAKGFIGKPFDIPQLLEEIRKIIAGQ